MTPLKASITPGRERAADVSVQFMGQRGRAGYCGGGGYFGEACPVLA
jgi:hypothetical protein